MTAATKARDRHPGADIRPGAHVVLAASSHVDRREADTDLFTRAAAVYTDDLDLARVHSGDLRTAVADGALAWDDVPAPGGGPGRRGDTAGGAAGDRAGGAEGGAAGP